MYKIGATRYAHHVKIKAEHQLFLDYTHADYKRKRHFLDEELPEQPKLSKIWGAFLNVVGAIFSMNRDYWGLPLLIEFGLLIYLNESPSPVSTRSSSSSGYHSSSSVNEYTIEMTESTSIGNGEEKSVSDLPQVIDDSNQTGFENEGDSGNDSTSPAESTHRRFLVFSTKLVGSDGVCAVINTESVRLPRNTWPKSFGFPDSCIFSSRRTQINTQHASFSSNLHAWTAVL